ITHIEPPAPPAKPDGVRISNRENRANARPGGDSNTRATGPRPVRSALGGHDLLAPDGSVKQTIGYLRDVCPQHDRSARLAGNDVVDQRPEHCPKAPRR